MAAPVQAGVYTGRPPRLTCIQVSRRWAPPLGPSAAQTRRPRGSSAVDIPSAMNQTRIPAGGWHRRPGPHAHLCLRLGAGLSVRPALTAGELSTTVSRAEQTQLTAHAHHRRQAQAPPPWDTTKVVAGVRAVPPSAARAPGFLQRAMLDLIVVIQAGSGTLKKGRQFLKNTQLRPYTILLHGPVPQDPPHVCPLRQSPTPCPLGL